MSDPIVSNPDLYKVVFENDRVRVLEYVDHPGDGTTPHKHPDSVMITLSSFSRRLKSGDRHADVEMTRHEIRWLDAQEHSGENIGTSDTHVVFVELKDAASEGAAPTDSSTGLLGPR